MGGSVGGVRYLFRLFDVASLKMALLILWFRVRVEGKTSGLGFLSRQRCNSSSLVIQRKKKDKKKHL